MLIVGGNQSAGGYEVDNSLRFNSASSDYLSLLYGTSGNRKTFTFSTWFKRSSIGVQQKLLGTNYTGEEFMLYFLSTDELALFSYAGGGVTTKVHLKTTQKFRDPSAWYHIMFAIDTTQATASDRANMYINGQLVTDFLIETYPTLNSDLAWISSTHTMYIGGTQYISGYVAETITVDGSQLDETSFGEFDADSGIWKPIDVSGLTFGSKGFYLPYENSAALGQDDSGNGNNWTVNNLTSDDQTTDTPTNNYATWNSIIKSPITLSEGNLQMGGGTLNWDSTVTTIVPQKGKWYAEIKVTSLVYDNIGFVTIDSFTDGTGRFYEKSNNISWLNNVSTIRNYQGASSTTAAVTGGSNSGFSRTSGDIVMLAFDMENGYGWFGKNGTWLNSGDPASGTNAFILSSDYANGTAIYAGYYSAVIQANFGNSSFTISSGNSDGNGYGNFEYSVPSGYYALNTKNLAEYG